MEILQTYQTLPRVLVQEAHSNIERSTTPALNTVSICKGVAGFSGNVRHIGSAQAGGQKRLVSVAPGSVHDKGSRVFADSLGNCLWAVLNNDVAPADFARESRIKRGSGGVLSVLELGDDDLSPEAWFSLKTDLDKLSFQKILWNRTNSLSFDGASVDG